MSQAEYWRLYRQALQKGVLMKARRKIAHCSCRSYSQMSSIAVVTTGQLIPTLAKLLNLRPGRTCAGRRHL